MIPNRLLTYKFCEYYTDCDTFKAKYNALPGCLKALTSDQIECVYYLLYANYGNSSFANVSIDQANLKMFSLIYQYGPIYFKKREVQEKILALNLDSMDVLGGTTAIYNNAANDGGLPTDQSTTELGYVDSQSVTKYKRSKLEGLSNYYDLLNNDVTKEFIGKFKGLFAMFTLPNLLKCEEPES